MNNKRTKKFALKKSIMEMKVTTIAIGIAVLFLPFVCYIVLRIIKSDDILIPFGTIFLLAGVFFENWKISRSWSMVFKLAIGAFILSFLSFFPGLNGGGIDFESNVKAWPYYFLTFYVMLTTLYMGDKIRVHFEEEFTLVLSMCFIYWCSDRWLLNGLVSNLFVLQVFLLSFGIMVALFSIVNAFVSIELSRSLRFLLGFWSTLILVILATDNIYQLYQQGLIEHSSILLDKIYLALNYFLLGISSIYIGQNAMLILGFFLLITIVQKKLI